MGSQLMYEIIGETMDKMIEDTVTNRSLIHYIQITGNIGSGKSTYLNKLIGRMTTGDDSVFEELGLHGLRPIDVYVFKEPVDNNPILPLLYNFPSENAFHMESFMMNYMYKRIRTCIEQILGTVVSRPYNNEVLKIEWDKTDHTRSGHIILSDYGDAWPFIMSMKSIGLIDLWESSILLQMYNKIDWKIGLSCSSATIISIDVPIAECLKGIMDRGRECEQNIKLDFLERLEKYRLERIEQCLGLGYKIIRKKRE